MQNDEQMSEVQTDGISNNGRREDAWPTARVSKRVYSCCQIVAWADEQWLAWFEATQEDSRLVDNMTGRPQLAEGDREGVLVPVRLRQQQVPWYRHS